MSSKSAVLVVVGTAAAMAIMDALFHIHHGCWDTSGRVHHDRSAGTLASEPRARMA